MMDKLTEAQKPLFDSWQRRAYRGATRRPKGNEREIEFLAMVKQCECGEWHLELKCRQCQDPQKNEKEK